MIILALALAASPAITPALSAEQDKEIIVFGRKLDTWRGSARSKKGRFECRTTRSSGDPKVDAIACAAMSGCMSKMQPKVDRLLAAQPRKGERERLLQPINAELQQCMKAAHAVELRRLAAEDEASQTE